MLPIFSLGFKVPIAIKHEVLVFCAVFPLVFLFAVGFEKEVIGIILNLQ